MPDENAPADANLCVHMPLSLIYVEKAKLVEIEIQWGVVGKYVGTRRPWSLEDEVVKSVSSNFSAWPLLFL